jgi:hypothetical protein
MNVGPAQFSSVALDVYETAKPVRAAQLHHASSEGRQVEQVPKPQNLAPVPSLVQDEVRVQWDTKAHLMIYEFVNLHSGALVLQVPSREVLNLTRGIHESLQKESSQRESLQKETLGKEPLQKESLRQESVQEQSARQESIRREIAKPAPAPLETAGRERKKDNAN